MEQQRQPEPDPDTLLDLSSQLLSLRDFAAARKYALLAQRSDPTRPQPLQIVAIADVLLAAEKRLPNGLPEWSSILQLQAGSATDDRACMRSQFAKLLALVHPSKNNFPFCPEAFNLVCNAWSALAHTKRTGRDGNDVGYDNGRPEEREKEAESEKQKGTFWTVCPYCFYVYEYDKAYEDCCLKCQNCRRAFHGLAVAPPPSVAEGKEEYYCGYGYLPLKYYLHGQSGGGDKCGFEKGDEKGFKGNPEEVVVMEISDDSDEDTAGKEKESEKKKQNGNEGWPANMQGSCGTGVRNEGQKGSYMKSVPRNSKKLMGTGQNRMRKLQLRKSLGIEWADADAQFGNAVGGTGAESWCGNGTEDWCSSDCDLEFFCGDNDIYVGLKNGN